MLFKLLNDGGPYHIDTSPMIFIANLWTDFYMTETSVIKVFRFELRFLLEELEVRFQKLKISCNIIRKILHSQIAISPTFLT